MTMYETAEQWPGTVVQAHLHVCVCAVHWSASDAIVGTSMSAVHGYVLGQRHIRCHLGADDSPDYQETGPVMDAHCDPLVSILGPGGLFPPPSPPDPVSMWDH